MKANIRIMLLGALIVFSTATGALAQRIITGTVYRDGEPAAGITVEAQRGSEMLTSFDGKYEVEADERTRWLRFTFIDDRKQLDIDELEGNTFNFNFDTGERITGEVEQDDGAEVVLKTREELVQEQNRDFLNELSMFTEFYKQENYNSAIPHWRTLYRTYPISTENVYIQGIKMYSDLMNAATSPEQKEEYFNQLMKIYDQRIEYFDDEGYNLGRKATDWLEHKVGPDNNLSPEERREALKTGYDWISRSVELQGNESELAVVLLLMRTSSSLYQLDELPQETVVEDYNTAMNIVNQVLENSDDEQRLSNAETVKPHIDDIFGTSGAANCDALISIFTPQYQENIDDAEFIRTMLQRLRRADCDESDLYAEATEKLYELEPSAEAAFNMAHSYLSDENFEKAKEYYQEAMDQETDDEMLKLYNYEYAALLMQDNDYQEARNYLRRALAIDPDYCEALLLMGNNYVSASNTFSEDEFEKATVFWLAVDYFERARRTGTEDCADDAAAQANRYRSYFPNQEEVFFRSYEEGESYTVGGWINESTTVRF